MEVEAKFVLPDLDALQQLQAVAGLGGYHLGEASSQQIVDCYLDTAERAILMGGYACRLRRTAEARCITLKGLGNAQDAIHQRFEDEVRLPSEADEHRPESWPAGSVRELVLN